MKEYIYLLFIFFIGLISILEFFHKEKMRREITGGLQLLICVFILFFYLNWLPTVESELVAVKTFSYTGGLFFGMSYSDQLHGSLYMLVPFVLLQLFFSVLFIRRAKSKELFRALFILSTMIFALLVLHLRPILFSSDSPLLSGKYDISPEAKTASILISFAIALSGISVGLCFYMIYIIKFESEKPNKVK